MAQGEGGEALADGVGGEVDEGVEVAGGDEEPGEADGGGINASGDENHNAGYIEQYRGFEEVAVVARGLADGGWLDAAFVELEEARRELLSAYCVQTAEGHGEHDENHEEKHGEERIENGVGVEYRHERPFMRVVFDTDRLANRARFFSPPGDIRQRQIPPAFPVGE